jgi:hypothetical protein
MQGQDSDFPEPGENEEHSMEGHVKQESRFDGNPSTSGGKDTTAEQKK